MRVELDAVRVGERVHALPSTTLRYESTLATYGFAETEQRPTVLGLLASGRMRPQHGEVRVDGRVDPAALRRRTALVDAPDVSAPEPQVFVGTVIAEELMFAGRRADPRATRRWADHHDLLDDIRRPMATLPPTTRLRMLCELAVLRRDVEGLVVVAPDRHGGDPKAWWRLADEFAGRSYAVLVVGGEAARLVLGLKPGVPGAAVAPLKAAG